MRAFLAQYEAFLEIDPDDGTGERLRARAFYGFGWAFVFVQMLNMIGMTFTYRAWVGDHWIAVGASLLVICAIHLMRVFKVFMVYAGFVIILTAGGVFASALPDGTGINSALIPFLIMAPMLNGFISGPRMAVVTGFLAIAVVAFLYYWSLIHPQPDTLFYEQRNFQRAAQAVFAIGLVTTISSLFSANIFRAFSLLEENVRRARKAEAAKAEFLATMSHEIRTPLNGVLGLNAALARTRLDAEQSHLVSTIGSSGQSLLMLLNDILDLSKIDAGKLEIGEHGFDLRDMVRETANTWRETIHEKGLGFTVDVAPETPAFVLGDDLRIRQIISNFLSNAVKFTEHGMIALMVTSIPEDSDAHLVQFAVADTGDGLDDDVKEKIFNSFEQAEAGAARRYGGAGLGLSICRRLANMMGGSVNLDSKKGKGSTFYLTLPMRVAAIRSSSLSEGETYFDAASKTGRRQALIGKTALVVEDNLVNQMVLGKFLDALGVGYEVAINGAECLERIEQQSFDVILMDKHMPVMDGVKAMTSIRARGDEMATVPIIACTADAMTGEKEALIEAGFSAFLSKPIVPELLEAALGEVLAKRGRAAA